MKEHRDSIKLALISEEAAEWFIRLKDDKPDQAGQDDYLRWLTGSPDHIAEALRMGQTYGLLRRAKLEQPGPDDELWKLAQSNVIELELHDRGERLSGNDTEAPREERGRAGWRRWAMAAAWPVVILAGLLAAMVHYGWFAPTIETAASEWRHFTLADGSIVRAGPLTRLDVRFEDARRVIQLSGGEALFQVARDPARPFVVRAGTAIVRAVGTEFGVSTKEGRVLVTVAEGEVAVSQLARRPGWLPGENSLEEASPERASVAVTAGEQAAVPKKGPVTVQRVNVANELAWAQGRLIFESKNVAQAIEEFNSRNRLQIEVRDSAIASRPVRGVFDAGDPESFAQFLARAARAEIIRDRPGVLLLRPLDDIAPLDDAGDTPPGDEPGTVLPPGFNRAEQPDEPAAGAYGANGRAGAN